jgi:hypothetical protein
MLKKIKLNKISQKIVISCLFILIIAGAFFIFNNHFALAQTTDEKFGLNYAAKIGLSSQDPRVVILGLVRLALGFVGLIAVFLMMYAGFMWMTSAGDEGKIETAKKTLTNTIIGLIIILSAFMIVSFIINKLNGTAISNNVGGGNSNTSGGIGAIGNCAIDSVYPANMQKEVPRNTSLVVTFRDVIDPLSLLDTNGKILTGNNSGIEIYKTSDGKSGAIADVNGTTTDDKTFIFTPVNYLGSPSEDTYYTVYLSNNIKNQSGAGVFDKCGIAKYFSWQFQVSTRIDLTPPQVLKNGVFPVPDNVQDASAGAAAKYAAGKITVASQPQAYTPAHLSGVVSPQTSSPTASISIEDHCQFDGPLTLTVDNTSSTTVVLSKNSTKLGSSVFIGMTTIFSGCFTFTTDSVPQAGNSWDFTLVGEKQGDSLTVGNTKYVFVNSSPIGNQIQKGMDINDTADKIVSALAGDTNVNVVSSGNLVTLTAKLAGAAGNNIILNSSSNTVLPVVALTGGSDKQETFTVNGKKDQPRNSIIQINFNEAVMPITLSGDADTLQNYIRVENAGGGANAGTTCSVNSDCLSYNCVGGLCQNNFLAGKFMISNQYQTVEFISNDVCGVNACGEKIYCLPENSHLVVKVNAAALDDCTNCSARAPFTTCNNSHCYNSTASQNYPFAKQPINGTVDMAMNSLDGNRNGNAEGPVDYFNENITSTLGDNYRWSFYINDIIDMNPPTITSVAPNMSASDANLSDPVKIKFSKLMMSSSLDTGSRLIDDGKNKTEHKLINLWDFSNVPVGYWITKIDLDTEAPLDGSPDITQAAINHSLFPDATSFRAQVGSGVKDIYQNCYSPSSGLGCSATDLNRSCCPSGGTLTATSVPAGKGCP